MEKEFPTVNWEKIKEKKKEMVYKMEKIIRHSLKEKLICSNCSHQEFCPFLDSILSFLVEVNRLMWVKYGHQDIFKKTFLEYVEIVNRELKRECTHFIPLKNEKNEN